MKHRFNIKRFLYTAHRGLIACLAYIARHVMAIVWRNLQAAALLLVISLATLVPAVAQTPKNSSVSFGTSSTASILFALTFANSLKPDYQIDNLVLTFKADTQSAPLQFSITPVRIEPRKFSEFLVRLDLAPGQYELTRILGVAGSGKIAAQLDLSVSMPFELSTVDTYYLGRIAVDNVARQDPGDVPTGFVGIGPLQEAAGFAQGTPAISARDAFDEDINRFNTLWPDLAPRRAAILLPPYLRLLAPRGLPVLYRDALFSVSKDRNVSDVIQTTQTEALTQHQRGVAPNADDRETPAERQAVAGEFVAGVKLTATEGARLPQSALQFYQRFLKGSYPRALAVSESGAAGLAIGGRDTLQRALTDCERNNRDASKRCQLFAVDDTVVEPKRHTQPTAQR
jgi:hypothetical protein